jgi:flagellar biosynthesis protein FlhB
MLAWLWTSSGELLRLAIHSSTIDLTNIAQASNLAIVNLMKISVPLFAVTAAAALASKLTVTRGLLPGLGPNFGSQLVNPLNGITRLFTWRSIVALLSSIALCLAVLVYALGWFRNHAATIAGTLGNLRGGQRLIATTAEQLAWFAVFVWLAVGCTDYIFAHRDWLNRHMMSTEEKQREQKEAEGDPLILLQRSRLRRQILSESTAWSVAEATVVIQHSARLAVVLLYVPSEASAPRLLGVCTANQAVTIIVEAKRHDVPVVDNPALAWALSGCAVGESIPEHLYGQVAETLSAIQAYWA